MATAYRTVVYALTDEDYFQSTVDDLQRQFTESMNKAVAGKPTVDGLFAMSASDEMARLDAIREIVLDDKLMAFTARERIRAIIDVMWPAEARP